MTVDEEPNLSVEVLETGVAVVLFSRPEKLNALSSVLLADIALAFRELSKNPKVRSVVLSGQGRGFSAGGDLTELHPLLSQAGVNGARNHMRAFQEAVTVIREIPVPVVAAINGVCAGAGISMALACDQIVAAEDAVFRPSFTRAGLLPDLGALHTWTRIVGPYRAKEMAYFAEPFSANEALRLGFVGRVVGAGDALKAGMELAQKLAEGPSAAYQMIKNIINATDQASLDLVFQLESYAQSAAFRTGEVDEGVAAFMERREPKFGLPK